ncbi:MAG TPA: GTP-binding protein [Cyanobacteria bacterium UBA12227]|nr:GTP-binding protein [Cyanobacteria bacterium UBA12227]
MISKKICLVGDFGVGKTSLIRRFVDRQFSDQYLSTVGVKISREVVETVNLQLLIWDLEGHTKFKAIAPSYLQGASGIIIVADVSRIETIERLGEHIKLFLSVNPKGVILVALNKSDLIEPEKLKQLVEMVEVKDINQVSGLYITSAKTGKSVDEIFVNLGQKLLESV